MDKKQENYFFNRSNKPFFEKDFKKAYYFCLHSIKINPRFRPGYLRLGNIALELKKYDEAIEYYKIFLFHSKKKKAYSDILKAYNSIGYVYSKQDALSDALKYYYLALKTAQKFNQQKSISTTYNNIALAYKDKKEFRMSLYFYKLAIDTATKNNDDLNTAYYYFNITMMYKEEKKYFRAFYYLKKFKKTKRALKDKDIELSFTKDKTPSKG